MPNRFFYDSRGFFLTHSWEHKVFFPPNCSTDSLTSMPDGQCSMADLGPKDASFGWATYGWAICIIDTFIALDPVALVPGP